MGGRDSDIELVNKSEFLTKLPPNHPRDQILPDGGFTMKDELACITGPGVELLTPSFIKRRDQFSTKDVETSRSLSSVRIHIEHVIGLLKYTFAILQGIIPLKVHLH